MDKALGRFYRCCFLFHMYLIMGRHGLQPSDLGVMSSGQHGPVHCPADPLWAGLTCCLLCPLPTPPPSATPAPSKLSGFRSYY